jgi:hypothetical protein
MNKGKLILIVITGLILVSFSQPLIANEDSPDFSLNVQPPTHWHSLMELAAYMVNILVWLAFAALTFAILYAGFSFVTSGGKPEKVKKARDAIVMSLVGLLIILFSKLIIAIIKGVFSGSV